jgi:hypothetical protein
MSCCGTTEKKELEALLTTPEQIAAALKELGYVVQSVADGIVVTSLQERFPVAIQLREAEVKITLELCEWSRIPEGRQAEVAVAALDANTLDSIAPFAFGINTGAEVEEEGAILVLVDSVGNGFLTKDTLDYSMKALLEAVVASRDVLEIAFA